MTMAMAVMTMVRTTVRSRTVMQSRTTTADE
jgi:hypothetical protein